MFVRIRTPILGQDNASVHDTGLENPMIPALHCSFSYLIDSGTKMTMKPEGKRQGNGHTFEAPRERLCALFIFLIRN